MQTHSLSLIIPAYNEEALIEKAINDNLLVLINAKLDFEIIIIDDGSKDKTKKIVEEKFIQLSKIKFHSKTNGGFGSAIIKGIELSTCEYVMYAPVDSPMDENILGILLSHLRKADILVSYRTERKGYTPRMKMNSGLYHILISWLFGMKLKDYNWIQCYKRKIFENINIQNGRIFMLAEVLIKAKRLGYTFYEFPVEMQERKEGRKTAASYKAAAQTFVDLIRFYFRIK